VAELAVQSNFGRSDPADRYRGIGKTINIERVRLS
jgi:hypothetical protein